MIKTENTFGANKRELNEVPILEFDLLHKDFYGNKQFDVIINDGKVVKIVNHE